jgi:hypothetical protein
MTKQTKYYVLVNITWTKADHNRRGDLPMTESVITSRPSKNLTETIRDILTDEYGGCRPTSFNFTQITKAMFNQRLNDIVNGNCPANFYKRGLVA